MGVTFTLDVEPHAPPGTRSRHGDITRLLLDRLDAAGIRGTVFVLGIVAEEDPGLVRSITAHGHELGLHGWSHEALPDLGRERFRHDAAKGKTLLEELSGAPVVGFRAPMFSLVPESSWAIDTLAELGFAYSSSVLPARSPLYGDPGAPARPFRRPNGLVELPCPVAGWRSLGLPYLGGTYLRLLPSPALRIVRSLFDRDQALWTYCHPYDFDPDEARWVDPSVGRVGSRLLWYGRRRAWQKLTRLLADPAPPLVERLDDLSSRD